VKPGTSHKHHYIPCFYLRQWIGEDGRLCEFSRPYGEVKPRRTHPSGTGYEWDLYTDDRLPTNADSSLEDVFLKRVDQRASDALQLLVLDQMNELTVEMRSAWSRFLISLIQRNPEKMAWLREQWVTRFGETLAAIESEYEALGRPADLGAFEALRTDLDPRAGARTLQRLIDLRRVGAFINQMRWQTVSFNGLDHSLLTSDRPVIMTNGLKYADSHIVMPMGPAHLFLAANNTETEHQLRKLGARELAQRANDRVARQAKKYVYGRDGRQLRFVENRLGHGDVQFIGSDTSEKDGPL
jgi:hypothetical protein